MGSNGSILSYVFSNPTLHEDATASNQLLPLAVPDYLPEKPEVVVNEGHPDELAVTQVQDGTLDLDLGPCPAPPGDSYAATLWDAKAPLPSPSESKDNVIESSKQRDADTRPSVRQLQKQYRKVHSLRDELITTRGDIKYQKLRIAHDERHVQESGDAFMMAVNQAFANGFSTSKDDLKTVREQLQSDFDRLGMKRDEMNAKEDILSLREHRLEEQETELMKMLEAFWGNSPDFQVKVTGSETESQTSVAPSTESENIPPLLREYYDKVGDVGIFEQRLDDLIDDYEEESANRQFRADQELPADPPDEVFEQAFAFQRNTTLEDLAAAKADAERLRLRCLDAGLHPQEEHDHLATSLIDDFVFVTPQSFLMEQRFPEFFEQGETDKDTGQSNWPQNDVGDSVATRSRGLLERVNGWILDVLRLSSLEVLNYRAAAKCVEEEKQYQLPTLDHELAKVVRQHWRADEGAVGHALTPRRNAETGLQEFHDTPLQDDSCPSSEPVPDDRSSAINRRSSSERKGSGTTSNVDEPVPDTGDLLVTVA
ncbi:hypothetical protein M8818_000816 [Zalaria obscura]|uniref:Uncharacterized protein n=1 Tax=Zalaria obscura TaxID=2024903 RepID=A0ACC3SPE6_9PEZI